MNCGEEGSEEAQEVARKLTSIQRRTLKIKGTDHATAWKQQFCLNKINYCGQFKLIFDFVIVWLWFVFIFFSLEYFEIKDKGGYLAL